MIDDGKKSLNLTPAKIALIVIMAVILVWCVFSLPFYAENQGLAVGTAIADAGISAEQLDSTLDTIVALFKIDEEEFDLDAASSFSYATITTWNGISAEKIANIGISAHYPGESKKSVFSVVKYAPLLDKIKSTLKLFEPEEPIEYDGPPLLLSREQWQDTAEQIKLLTANVLQLSEQQWREMIKTINQVIMAQNILDEVSFKSLRKLADAIFAVCNNVDFAKIYALDLFFGYGFASSFGADCTYLLQKARQFEYDRLIEIAFLLPNKTDAVFELVKYVFQERGVSLDIFIHALDTLKVYGRLPEDFATQTIREELEFLLAAPDSPTDEELEEIGAHVQILLNVF